MMSILALASFVAVYVFNVQAYVAPNIASHIIARQFGGTPLPSQCETICGTFLNGSNTCSTLTCLCTQSNADGLASCVDCIVSVGPSPDIIVMGQGILNNFTTQCDSGGSTISSEVVSVSSVVPLSSTSGTGVPAQSSTGFFLSTTSSHSQSQSPSISASSTSSSASTSSTNTNTNTNGAISLSIKSSSLQTVAIIIHIFLGLGTLAV